jgi:hypothetical protein
MLPVEIAMGLEIMMALNGANLITTSLVYSDSTGGNKRKSNPFDPNGPTCQHIGTW